MRVGSLFSGIGGFDLGLERAGFTIVWQVEIDPYCQRVLAKHWPHVRRYGDITTMDWATVQPVDLLCGGFPCQPFSCAGKKRGRDDDRYLWPEVVRCLSTIRPTWFLGENVPGLLNLGINQVLADLEALGYQTQVLGIPACAVDAPHIRQRLWIIAYAEGQRANGTSRAILKEDGGSVHELPREFEWSSDVANSTQLFSDGSQLHREHAFSQVPEPGNRGGAERDVADAFLQQRLRWSDGVGWWEREPQETLCALGGGRKEEDGLSIPESLLGRVAHGVPSRLDRLRGLGNAVVPQIVEALGRMILDAETQAQRRQACHG